MKTLLSATALIMSAGMACAQAAEKNDWHFNIGAMYEIENVEGQSEDMDGLAEPSVYFNASNGPWKISLAYYQKDRLITARVSAVRGLTAQNWKSAINSSKARMLISA